ncbi:MAG TPA: hypothetical protein VGR28_04125 [Candidatus Thermoplasmatota archaeon]|jgi:hypothetical protein|nr:hypothetical protein [Candidatus Thermoplasmatota archaeon]
MAEPVTRGARAWERSATAASQVWARSVRAMPWMFLAAGLMLLVVSLTYSLRQEFAAVALVAAAPLAALRGRDESPPAPTMLRERAVGWLLPSLLLLCLALALLFIDPAEHVRRAGFFVCFAAAAVLLAAQVALVDPERGAGRILAQMALLSVVFSGSVFWLFPGYFGVDPWFHARQVEEILATGQVPPGTNYSAFPGLHLLVAQAALLSALPTKAAYFLVGASMALLPGLVWLAARPFVRPRAALAAALLVGLASFPLYWGFWISSNTLGALLGVLAFALLLPLLPRGADQRDALRWVALLLVALAALTVTHALSTFVAFTMLVAAVGALMLAQRTPRGLVVPAAAVALFAVLFLSYWLVAATYNGEPTFAFASKVLNRFVGEAGSAGVAVGQTLTTPPPPAAGPGTNATGGGGTVAPNPGGGIVPAPAPVASADDPPFDLGSVTRITALDVPTALLVNLGYAVFLALFLAGAARLLRGPGGRTAPWVGGSFALLAVVEAAVLLGAPFILPHRWIVFALALGAPVAAVGLTGATRGAGSRVFALGAAALLLSGSAAASSWSNPDSPVIALPSWDRYGFTSPELDAAAWAHDQGLAFATDFWFARAADAPAGAATRSTFTASATKAMVVRDYLLDHAISLPMEGGYYVTTHANAAPLVKGLEGRFDAVYDSGAARVLVRPGVAP